jgi:protein O-mannosyl-transferase
MTGRTDPQDAGGRGSWPTAVARAWPAALLVAVTLATHGNTLSNGFVWDDERIIVKNPETRDLALLGKVVLSPDETPPYYRPLNRASYLVDYQLFGLDPRGFHLANLALQVGCVLALFALGRRLFESRAAAVLAALLLAVHPIGVEAVAFVTARNNLLALLFSLVALALFIDAERRDAWLQAWLSAVALFLGLLSKEPAAMVLPVMAAWLLVGRAGRPPLLRRARLLAPHLAFVCAYLALRAVSLGGLVGAATEAAQAAAPFGQRLEANLLAVPTYLGLLLLPWRLTIYHLLPEPTPITVAWSVAAWLGLVAGAVLLLRRRSAPALLGMAWFAFGLVPIANLVSLPTATVIAERYVFIPAVGLWLVAADLFDGAWRRTAWRTGLVTAAVAITVLLAGRTVVRNRDWKDDLTLARAAVEVEPRAPMAQYNLGLALEERGSRAEAVVHWEEAVRLDRIDGRAHVALGNVAAERGDAAAAERHYRAALGMIVGPVEGHLNLGKLYDRMGQPARAQAEWEEVLRADPEHPDALAQLGALRASHHDLVGAEAYFRRALRSDPEMREALFNLGKLCELTGRPAEALSFYERFLGTGPARTDDASGIAARRVADLRRSLGR